VNPFRLFLRFLGRGIDPSQGPLPTQDGTTQENVGIYSCLELNSNPRSQHSDCAIHMQLRSRGRWDRPVYYFIAQISLYMTLHEYLVCLTNV